MADPAPAGPKLRLSILVPVYNERSVAEASLRQILAAPLPENMDRELVVVDDCSRDGTWDILRRLTAEHPDTIRLFRHERNQGKGAAVRTAIAQAAGDFAIIQDADLEYDPSEYPRLLKPLLDGRADVVYGSRYLAGEGRRVLPFWHSMINGALTGASNVFSNLHLTDMETCYKVFHTDVLRSIPIRSDRFGIEPEITMKCAKRRLRIYEVPISYHGRTYEEGKKIGWRDGVKVLGVLLHFWLVDDLYTNPHGRGSLNNLYGTPRYIDWITRVLRPHVGDSVLEVGAGVGNLAGRLMGRRTRYIAGEHEPLYLKSLRNRFLRTPNVEVRRLEPEGEAGWEGLSVDTAICLNILEYATDPAAVLRRLHAALRPDGTLLVLVPHGRGLFGTVDAALGVRRRFDRTEIERLLGDNGFAVERIVELNRAAVPGWWLSSCVLKRDHVSRFALKVFDKTVWLWRLLNPVLPWRGLSLVVVGRRGR